MKVLNYGSLNIDLVYSVEHFVRAGETIACNKFERFAGGKGLNQSVALGRAQAHVYHAGKVGADGLFLLDLLSDAQVDTSLTLTNGSATGTAVIQVEEESGQNCIIIHGGANQENTHDEIDSMLDSFDEGDLLLLQNEVNDLPYAIERAKKKGMLVAFNPSPITSQLKSLPLEWIDMWILNEVEGQELTGSSSAEGMLNALHGKYPHAQIVLTLGSDGCVCMHDGKTYTQRAFPVDAVDTTAAGDTFTGFYLAGYARGRSVPEALRFASKAASIAVTRPGAGPSIPTLEEVTASLL